MTRREEEWRAKAASFNEQLELEVSRPSEDVFSQYNQVQYSLCGAQS